MLSSLEANIFHPIGEDIDRCEYHSDILDDGAGHVRLEGDLNPEMPRHQISILYVCTSYLNNSITVSRPFQRQSFKAAPDLPYHVSKKSLLQLGLITELRRVR